MVSYQAQSRSRFPCLSVIVILIIATQITCTSDMLGETTNESAPLNLSTDRFYVMNATNRFLSLIFEELETGLGQVLENSPLKNQ